LFTPPDVAVIVRVYVPFGVDGPPQPASSIKMRMAVATPSRVRSRRVASKQNTNIKAISKGTICGIDKGGLRTEGGGGSDPLVATVAVEV